MKTKIISDAHILVLWKTCELHNENIVNNSLMNWVKNIISKTCSDLSTFIRFYSTDTFLFSPIQLAIKNTSPHIHTLNSNKRIYI